MNIQGFIANLLPTFGRDRVFEDLKFTQRDISDLVPIYVQAGKLFKGHSAKSETVQNLFSQFKRLVPGSGSDNAVVHIGEHLAEVLVNVSTVEKLAGIYLSSTVAGSGLTMKQATIVRFCDSLFLVARYARKFLNLVMAYEACEYEGLVSSKVEDAVPPAEVKWIVKNMMDFCYAYNAVIGDSETLTKEVEELPDINVSQANHGAIEATLGPKRIDPRKMNFIGGWSNPIYFLRMIVAEWQHARWKASKDELALLELRLAQLKKLQAKQSDAKLEKTIEYMEKRVKDLNASIAEMEK